MVRKMFVNWYRVRVHRFVKNVKIEVNKRNTVNILNLEGNLTILDTSRKMSNFRINVKKVFGVRIKLLDKNTCKHGIDIIF